MKTKCKACEGKAGNKACKDCKGSGYVMKMGDHKDYDMKKASELLKGLRDILPEDEAQTIVKGKIAAGECEDDLGASGLDVAALDAAVDAMQKSLTGNYETDLDPGDLVVKGGGLEDLADPNGDVEWDLAISHLVESNTAVAKGLNTLGREQRVSNEVLTKGLAATAMMVRDMANVIKGQASALDNIYARQDQIAVAMNAPIAPRSILTGASPIPAPFEQVAKGGVAEGTPGGAPAAAPPFTAHDVFKAATAEMNEIVKGGPVMDIQSKQRLNALGSAITACESGQPGTEIAAKYSIAVGS